MPDTSRAEIVGATESPASALAAPALPASSVKPVAPARSAARVLELDVLRGLSILMVIVGHTAIHPESHSALYWPIVALNRVGWSGVDVFFVLSGYLVGGLLMREYQDTGTLQPRRFWVRRAFKVWPTFYAFLAAMLAYDVVALEHGSIAGRFAGAMAKYWPNFLHIQNYRVTECGWLWSLAVEEHFYLLLPWTLTFVLGTRSGATRPTPATIARRMTACFVGITATCTALRALALAHGGVTVETGAFPTHLRIDSLFWGVYLAYVARFHADAIERLRPWRHAIVAASLAAWLPFYFDGGHEAQLRLYPFGLSLLSIGSVGLVTVAHLAATRPSPPPPLLAIPMKALGWLGVRSYAVYVWHGFFAKPIAHRIVNALHLTGEAPGIVGWAHDGVYVATYVALGAVMYRLIELPGLRLRQRLAPPTVPTAAPSA